MSLLPRWVVISVVTWLHTQPTFALQCHRGEMLHTSSSDQDFCVPCSSGFFMPDELHTQTQCYLCTEIRDPRLEILASPCNKSHDTEIHCIHGYYRTQPSYPDVRGQCRKCRKCPYPLRPCQKFRDTVCCPGHQYGVYINKDGNPECVRQCAQGQLWHAAEGKCLTCPRGTYMDEGRHVQNYCKECQTIKSERDIILHPCNSTHQTVIGCKNGFYRKKQSNSVPICEQCQNCADNSDGNIYEGRACDQSRDTVCCPQPDMAVVDTSDGPRCVPASTHSAVAALQTPVCGEGEYLSTNARSHSTTCQPCPQGTYMDEIKHTRGSCKSCEEFPHEKFCPPDVAVRSYVFTEREIALLVFITVALAVLAMLAIFMVWWKLRLRPSWRGLEDEKTPLVLDKGSHEGSMASLQGHSPVTGSTNAGGYIDLREFKTQHLQHMYCDVLVVELIKLQADLTVYVDVQGSSERRPKFFPGTNTSYPYYGDRNGIHQGSGWVERVMTHKDERCPCMACQRSAQPVTSWGEVVICTAARVVFDITEGRNSRCYFFLDTPGTGLRSCLSVSGAVKVLSDAMRDWCYMTFVTHDMDLVKKLQETNIKYHRLKREVKCKYGITEDHVKEEGISQSLEGLANMFESHAGQLDHHQKEINFKTKSAYNILFDLKLALGITDLGGDKREEVRQILSKLHTSCQHSRKVVDDLRKTYQDVQPGSGTEAKELLHDQYWYHFYKASELERYIRRLNFNLRNPAAVKGSLFKFRYDPSHSLTVVVSHPLGGPKKISLGETVDRKSIELDHSSAYIYTNTTDPGSEGARVFILGRRGPADHGHSGINGQFAESGMWFDIMPYIADLSVVAGEQQQQ